MPKVVTLGEVMLRLSPPSTQRFVQAASFDVTYGGGEANVAASLAQWGLEAAFVTKVPKHEVGQAAVNHLRRYGVDTRHVARGGDRLGIYFLETGAAQRGSKVVYDRAGASVTTLAPGEVDWAAAFDGADWFHFTGITPALGPTMRATLGEALAAAKAAGVRVSCDLNYRAKLWTTAEAQAVMRPLMAHVDVCIANEEDAEKSLGLSAGSTDVAGGHLDAEGYDRMIRRLREEYGFDVVAVTLRESLSASHNGWSALVHDGAGAAEPYRSARYDVWPIVDRVGGGDAFAAGLIYGLLTKRTADGAADARAALDFGVAASCLKHTVPGDFNHASVAEVEALAKGGGGGRVER